MSMSAALQALNDLFMEISSFFLFEHNARPPDYFDAPPRLTGRKAAW
jgi:hypothetical protein